MDASGQYAYEQGEKYYYGRGVGQDYAKALEWYLKAAEKGHSGAEYSIGWMYEYGPGVGPDSSMALIWYRRAAAHGNEDAQKGIDRLEKLVPARTGGNGGRNEKAGTAAGDPGAVSIFGRKVYLRSSWGDCDMLYDWCLIRKVGDRVYMATDELKYVAKKLEYSFKFCDTHCTNGTNFGYAVESQPGEYDYEKGIPIRLNHNGGWGEVRFKAPHDGKYDFYLDFSGDVPVTYVREHW